MAKNIKLKIRTSGGWEQLYPETIVDQIVDASTAGKNLFKLSTPAGDSYLKVTTGGAIQTVLATGLRAEIGAAPSVHTHKISDISVAETVNNGYIGKTLVQALNEKADLISGKVPVTQLPDFVLGGLQFKGQITTSVTLDAAFRTTNGIDTTAASRGKYFIATNNTTVSFGADTAIFAPGDEGDNTSPVTIEAGDWIVFVSHAAGVFSYAVVNNTQGFATTDAAGVVRISSTSAVNRGSLSTSTTDRHLRVVDERVLRNAMKDIFYATTEPANAVVGDILFQEEV